MAYTSGTVYAGNALSAIVGQLTQPLAESASSNEVSITLSNIGAVQLNLPTLSRGIQPSGWRIYRGTAPGNETLLTTVPGFFTSFYDDGSFTNSTQTPPITGIGQTYVNTYPVTGLSIASLPATGTWLDCEFNTYSTIETVAYNQPVAQPFIANHAYIHDIDLPLNILGAPQGNIIVSLYGATNDSNGNIIPNTAVSALGSVTVNLQFMTVFDGTNTSTYQKFTFSSAISVVPGKVYFIVATLDTPANTVASNNNVQWAKYNGTYMTPVFNGIFYNSTNNIASNPWTFASGGMNFIVNASGRLAAGTYYYVVTAMYGWSLVRSQQRPIINGVLIWDVIYSSGAHGTENIYATLATNSTTNNGVFLGVLESYNLNFQLLLQRDNATYYTVGASSASGDIYNLLVYSGLLSNSNIQSIAYNTTFYLHYFVDHFFLILSGDPGFSGFQTSFGFVGKITSLATNDNAYIVSSLNVYGNGPQYAMLRDVKNNLNQSLYPLFPMYSNPSFTHGSFVTCIPVQNKYTGNWDGLDMWLSDINNGVRGYMPDVVLFDKQTLPSIMTNLSIFNYNGQTYKLYNISNYPVVSLLIQFSAGSNYIYSEYYPAVRVS